MKKLLLPILCMLIGQVSLASSGDVKFGKIPVSYLEMQECDFYPSADAMLLLSSSNTFFEVNESSSATSVTFTKTVHKIFKVFNREGTDVANQKIQLFNPETEDGQVMMKIKAATYNLENGKVVATAVNKKEIYKSRSNEFQFAHTFAFPNVQNGSVLEVVYTFRSPYYMASPFFFQEEIPSANSIVKFAIPEFITYQKLVVGAPLKYEYDDSNGTLMFRNNVFKTDEFEVKATNVLPLIEEPFQINKNISQSRLECQISGFKFPNQTLRTSPNSYEGLSKKLKDASNFAGRLKTAGICRQLGIDRKSVPTLEQAKEIFLKHQHNINWNGRHSALSSSYGPSALKQEESNSATINLTLIASLREAGFTVYPILLRTAGNGFMHPVYAHIQGGDNVVAGLKLENKLYLLDASKTHPFGQLDPDCINGKGWMLTGDFGEWVDLEAGSFTKENTFVTTTLENGKVKHSFSHRPNKYNLWNIQRDLNTEGEEKVIETFNDEWDDFDEANTTLKIDGDKTSVHSEILSELDNSDIIYIQPFPFGMVTANPFVREERFSNIEFPYLFEKKLSQHISVPEGYTVEVPENLALTTVDQGIYYSYSVKQVGSNLMLNAVFTVKQKAFTPDMYNDVKEIYKLASLKQNEQIVLKKEN